MSSVGVHLTSVQKIARLMLVAEAGLRKGLVCEQPGVEMANSVFCCVLLVESELSSRCYAVAMEKNIGPFRFRGALLNENGPGKRSFQEFSGLQSTSRDQNNVMPVDEKKKKKKIR